MSQPAPSDIEKTASRQIAAIDLGSNSFHMVVANVIDNGLQIVSTHKQRVRMADGLDNNMYIDEEAIQRGLDCLAIFGERIQDFAPENVRIAATHTLRCALNRKLFLNKARDVLPFPIEVIAGVEEARLIYLGVAHTQHDIGKKLVVDIGGGSTEMIIGEGFEPIVLYSKQLGCVSYTNKFFQNGKLSKKNFANAVLAAEQTVENIASEYKKTGWELAFGSSGTIKAVREVIIALGYDDALITAKRLEHIIEVLIDAKKIEDLKLDGLSEQREPVFAAGVAILYAIFQSFKIKEMYFSDGALREGLMYEVEDRFQRLDIRMRTAENLADKHHVNLDHARSVQQQAEAFLLQLGASEKLPITPDSELGRMLKWSAMLHEVGLIIGYKSFHRHSAYILQHTNMPGFNQEQQELVATLVRFQRKSLKLQDMPEWSLYQTEQILPLIAILRLSILLNAQRNQDVDAPNLRLSSKSKHTHKTMDDKLDWQITCDDPNWQENHRLLHADLLEEQAYWEDAGWVLRF